MHRIRIRFYEELNDFIARERRKRDSEVVFRSQRSVKDLIESLGVPHTEIDVILVNGESVGFDYIVTDADRISVYPVFETLPVKDVTHLSSSPLRNPRFVCDVHLGKLAKRLRLLGWDARFENEADDEDLARITIDEERILLTRDKGLLMRKEIRRGVLIRFDNPEDQASQILDRLHLHEECKPFTLCLECGGLLVKTPRTSDPFDQIKEKIPPGVLAWCHDFGTCAGCQKIYWPGSHYGRLKEIVSRLLGEDEGNPKLEKHIPPEGS